MEKVPIVASKRTIKKNKTKSHTKTEESLEGIRYEKSKTTEINFEPEPQIENQGCPLLILINFFRWWISNSIQKKKV